MSKSERRKKVKKVVLQNANIEDLLSKEKTEEIEAESILYNSFVSCDDLMFAQLTQSSLSLPTWNFLWLLLRQRLHQ